MTRRRNPSVPTRRLTVQPLEARDCPAGSYLLAGHTLILRGDAGPNVFDIQDKGLTVDTQTGQVSPPNVYFAIEGSYLQVGNTITRVVVLGMGGDDVITYGPTVTAQGTQWLTLLSIDLGAGDDTAELTIARKKSDGPQGPTPSAPLDLRLRGGAGDDTVTAQVGQVDQVRVSVQALLGAGADTFIGVLRGPFLGQPPAAAAGSFRLDVRGDAGDDTVDVETGGIAAPNYQLGIDLWGGAGDDALTANVHVSGEIPTLVALRLEGGAGDDVAVAALRNETARFQDRAGKFISDQVQVNGGAGDDVLSVDYFEALQSLAVGLDGGDGFDTATAFGDLGGAGRVTTKLKAEDLLLV